MKINWDDSFELGVGEIDFDHRQMDTSKNSNLLAA